MDELLLSVASAIFGFLISQSINLINLLRRPRFRVNRFTYGVSSCYTGSPPETPWEIQLGFYLENCGWNPAKNTRVFVSDLHTANGADDPLEATGFEFAELKRPVDIIAAGEAVLVTFGTIGSDTHSLEISYPAESALGASDFLDADTREKKVFSAKFYIYCDDKSSSKVLQLTFCPEKDEWPGKLLEDYSAPLPTRPE